MLIKISRDYQLPSTSSMTSTFCIFLFAALCACVLGMNEIVVRIKDGSSPEQVAKAHGMTVKRKVSTFIVQCDHQLISIIHSSCIDFQILMYSKQDQYFQRE